MRKRTAVEKERLRRWLLAKGILESGEDIESVDRGEPEVVAEMTAATEGRGRAAKVVLRRRPRRP